MRIGIDGRIWGSSGRGVGRYVQNLVENLEKVDKKNEYVIFLRQGSFNLYQPRSKNFKKVLADIPWYGAEEQIALPALFSQENLDLLHVPHFNVPLLYRGKMVVTIHDLTMLKFGGRETSTLNLGLFLVKRVGLELILRQAVSRAAAIITPSKFVKDDVSRTFQVPKSKIFVTYEAGVLSGKERSSKEKKIENVLEKYRISSPYFLYVGGFYPHKNLSRLIEAIKILNEELGQPAQLVLVGTKDAFLEKLVREAMYQGALKYLSLTGQVSDADLIDLYRSATAYVQPSLSEGFGLPTVEAMALGVPVVQADASSLPEIAGAAALYFNPQDSREMAKSLKKVLTSEKIRSRLTKAGLSRAKDFSWEKMARETVKIYAKALKS